MSIPLTINGAVFEYPQDFDTEWGIDATGWAQAVTNGMLSLSGGNFPLTAQANFGPNFGLTALNLITETAAPASAGFIRLAKTDAIEWRNNANNANLALAIDGSDNLTFAGSPLSLTALTNAHIYVGNGLNVPTDVAMSNDATLDNTGALTIANGAITNAKVNATAAIAVTKLAALTVSRAVQTDSSGVLSTSSVTATELGYSSGLSGNIQTQIGTLLPLSGGTMSGAISMASHKITNVSAGSGSGDVAIVDQLPAVSGAITNWASYTCTVGGAGTIGSSNFQFKRIGDTLYVTAVIKTGTVSASTAYMTIPAGLSIDTTKIGGSSTALLGFWTRLTTGAVLTAPIFSDATTLDRVFFGYGAVTGSGYSLENGNSIWSDTEYQSVNFNVPIAGWSI